MVLSLCHKLRNFQGERTITKFFIMFTLFLIGVGCFIGAFMSLYDMIIVVEEAIDKADLDTMTKADAAATANADPTVAAILSGVSIVSTGVSAGYFAGRDRLRNLVPWLCMFAFCGILAIMSVYLDVGLQGKFGPMLITIISVVLVAFFSCELLQRAYYHKEKSDSEDERVTTDTNNRANTVAQMSEHRPRSVELAQIQANQAVVTEKGRAVTLQMRALNNQINELQAKGVPDHHLQPVREARDRLALIKNGVDADDSSDAEHRLISSKQDRDQLTLSRNGEQGIFMG